MPALLVFETLALGSGQGGHVQFADLVEVVGGALGLLHAEVDLGQLDILLVPVVLVLDQLPGQVGPGSSPS